jgi:hypothetical protein
MPASSPSCIRTTDDLHNKKKSPWSLSRNKELAIVCAPEAHQARAADNQLRLMYPALMEATSLGVSQDRLKPVEYASLTVCYDQ